MRITAQQYAQILYNLTGNKKENEIKDIIKEFIGLMISNGDVSKFDKLTSRFNRIWNKENSNVDVEIISARELDYKTIRLINDYIIDLTEAKQLTIKRTVNKNILGGVIIRYNDKIIDSSLRTNLLNLEEEMIK